MYGDAEELRKAKDGIKEDAMRRQAVTFKCMQLDFTSKQQTIELTFEESIVVKIVPKKQNDREKCIDW